MKQLKYLFCILWMCFLLTACSSNCPHIYTSRVTKEATCANIGETKYTCLLCQKFFRHMHCHRAVGNCGDHLAKKLGTHITHSIDTGDVGLGGLPCHDVAACIQLYLICKAFGCRLSAHADEYTVHRKFSDLTALQILHL